MGDSTFIVWHAVARILDGDARLLSDEQRALAFKVTQRDRFPADPIDEFFAGPGRRSGKSRFLAARAVYRWSQDYAHLLAPGEQATGVCVAPTTDQATLFLNYAAAMIRNSALLAPMLVRETVDELESSSGNRLKVFAGSFRSVRGVPIFGGYVDEASFLRSEESALPDVELVRALRPGLLTLRGDLFVTSSPYMKRGLMWDAHRSHYGNNDSRCLYVGGPSLLFNPTLDAAAVARAFADDPESTSAELGGNFRADMSAAFESAWIDAAVCDGVHELPPVAVLADGGAPFHIAATDPSGGTGKDSWSTRIVRPEREYLMDVAQLEIRPPFNTAEAARQVAEFLRRYRVSSVRGDKFAGAWPSDALAANGISYIPLGMPKSDIYRECVSLFSSGRVKLLDHARTVTQLRMLERRTRPGGRDSFDHPAGGSHDDNANALCAALWLASRAAAADVLPVGIENTTFDDYFDGHGASISRIRWNAPY